MPNQKINQLAGLFLLLFLSIQTLSAETGRKPNKGDHHDWGLWGLTTASYNVGKWRISGQLDYRMNQHMTRPSLYSPQLYVYYRPSQLLRLSYGYELYLKDDGWQNINVEHRMLVQGELYFNIQNLKIVSRTALYNDFAKFSDPTWVVRERLRFSYPIKKYEPYISTEVYFHFPSGMRHLKDRHIAGVDYKLNSKHSIGAYYMLEQFVKGSFSHHVIGFNYNYTIK